MDEVTIDHHVKIQNVTDSIVEFSRRSDYRQLSSILSDNSKHGKEIIAQAINLVGGENQTTALYACVVTQSGYDKENEKDGNNFKCFKLLLSIPGIDPSVVLYRSSIIYMCISMKKVAFYEYMLEMKRKHGNDKNSKFNLIDPLPIPQHSTSFFEWFPRTCGRYEMFESVFKHGIKADIQARSNSKNKVRKSQCDIHASLISVAMQTTARCGYDKNKGIECDNGKVFQLLLNDKGVDINYMNITL